MPRRFWDLLGSVLSIGALLAVAMAINGGVRDRVCTFVQTLQERSWLAGGERVAGLAGALIAGWQTQDLYLATFVVAAAVLVLLMLRT